MSTGTLQPQNSWFSRTSHLQLRKKSNPSLAEYQSPSKENSEMSTIRGEIKKAQAANKKQFTDLKERIYLFEYDLFELKSQNSELRQSVVALMKANHMFRKMIQSTEPSHAPIKSKELKPKAARASKTNKSPPKLKKVRSQQFLKSKMTHKMDRLEKLMSYKKSIYNKF